MSSLNTWKRWEDSANVVVKNLNMSIISCFQRFCHFHPKSSNIHLSAFLTSVINIKRVINSEYWLLIRTLFWKNCGFVSYDKYHRNVFIFYFNRSWILKFILLIPYWNKHVYFASPCNLNSKFLFGDFFSLLNRAFFVHVIMKKFTLGYCDQWARGRGYQVYETQKYYS